MDAAIVMMTRLRWAEIFLNGSHQTERRSLPTESTAACHVYATNASLHGGGYLLGFDRVRHGLPKFYVPVVGLMMMLLMMMRRRRGK